MKKLLITSVFFIGYLAIIFGAVACLAEKMYAFYVFTSGVVLLCIYRICTLTSGSYRIKRLNAMEAFSTVLFVISCVLMYMQLSGWILTLLIAVIIDLIVSFRYPNENK